MSYQVTQEQLSRFLPKVKQGDIEHILSVSNEVLARYEINQTLRRIRYFFAQSSFETNGFTDLIESLYYSTPERLTQVWPSRFTMTKNATKLYAPDYIKNPEKLANVVYANRLGNGSESSGDGWKYIGRGAFHLTGKDNYSRASKAIHGDNKYVIMPNLVADNWEDVFLTAGWFWDANKLNTLADRDEFTNTTKVIQGSTLSVSQRLEVLKRANQCFV